MQLRMALFLLGKMAPAHPNHICMSHLAFLKKWKDCNDQEQSKMEQANSSLG